MSMGQCLSLSYPWIFIALLFHSLCCLQFRSRVFFLNELCDCLTQSTDLFYPLLKSLNVLCVFAVQILGPNAKGGLITIPLYLLPFNLTEPETQNDTACAHCLRWSYLFFIWTNITETNVYTFAHITRLTDASAGFAASSSTICEIPT